MVFVCTTRIGNEKNVCSTRIGSAGTHIKDISKSEMKRKKKRPQTTRFEIWPDGGVGYKVVQSTRIEKGTVRILK